MHAWRQLWDVTVYLPHEILTFAKVIRLEGTTVPAERLCVYH